MSPAERGDIFYEHYYDGKPYGLWQVLTPDERTLKCWYCNISTPAHVSDNTITFRDLLLDVLLLPDGTCRVLDRDELVRARAEGLDPALAALAEDGAREVLDMIASHQPPFFSGGACGRHAVKEVDRRYLEVVLADRLAPRVAGDERERVEATSRKRAAMTPRGDGHDARFD